MAELTIKTLAVTLLISSAKHDILEKLTATKLVHAMQKTTKLEKPHLP